MPTGARNPGPENSARPMVWLDCNCTGCICVFMCPSQSMGFQEHTVQYASPLSPGERVHNLRFPSRLREEGKLLKAAANDGFGVQAYPLLQQRGIGTTEVVIVVQVAFAPLLGC